jgi:hypothetical protein
MDEDECVSVARELRFSFEFLFAGLGPALAEGQAAKDRRVSSGAHLGVPTLPIA